MTSSHKRSIADDNDNKAEDSLDIYRSSLTQTGDTDNISIPPSSESTIVSYCCFVDDEPLRQQKMWICCNGIIWLLVVIISIPLLLKKESNLVEFYNNDQCCFCLYVSYHHNTRIEWSPCLSKHKLNSNNFNNVCTINNKQYCNTSGSQQQGSLSQRTVHFLPKYYVYYGLLALFSVIMYLCLLFITTHKYKLLLPKQWFVGSIIVSIICFYPYIKLYQFRRQHFNQDEKSCNPPNIKSNYECYSSAINVISNTFLDLLAFYLEVYMIYLVYAVYPCMCVICGKCLAKLKCCKGFAKYLENIFFYLVKLFVSCLSLFLYTHSNITIVINQSVIAAPVFLSLSFFTLIYYAALFNDGEFQLVGILSNDVEQALIVIIGCLLLFTSFNMLLMDNCRNHTKEILCCRENRKKTYYGLMQQSINK